MVTSKKRSRIITVLVVIIIAIFGCLSLGSSYFSGDIATYRSNTERFAYNIYDIIRNFGNTILISSEKYIDSAIVVIDNQFGTQFTPAPSQDGNRVSSQSGVTTSTTSDNSDSINKKNYTNKGSTKNPKLSAQFALEYGSSFKREYPSNITIQGNTPFISSIVGIQMIAGSTNIDETSSFGGFIASPDSPSGSGVDIIDGTSTFSGTLGSLLTTGNSGELISSSGVISSPLVPLCNNTKINTCTLGTPVNQVSPDPLNLTCGQASTWSCTLSGQTSETCSIVLDPCPINGTCNNAAQFGCAVGTPSVTNSGSCGGSSTWSCLGSYSGTNATNCTKLNPVCPTNGSCDNATQYSCKSGIPSAKVEGSCGGGSSTWSCLGTDGGTDATSCTKLNPPCPVDGSCNLAIKYACSVGTSKAHVTGFCGGSATWSCAGANGGTDAVCTKANVECTVNGSCDNTTQFSCATGISGSYDAGVCGGISKWSCLGIAGGTDATNCKKNNPDCPVDGSCNLDTEFACTTGISDSNKIGSCGSSSTWNCLGTNGGSSATCSRFSSSCGSSSPKNSSILGAESGSGSSGSGSSGSGSGSSGSLINGSCDNSTNFSCSTGTSSGNLAGSCGGSATWSCLGANGGTDDLSCNKPNAPCPINGVCDNSTQFACTTGSGTANVAGSCGGSATWSCLGANGGSDDLSCTKPNAPCAINGSCNNAVQFACSAGTTSTNVAGSCGGSSTWSCLGVNGGSDDLSCARPNAPCSINGSCNNAVQFACTTGSGTANVAGSCGGSATWTCLGLGGGSNDTSCNKPNPACVINGACDNTTQFACTTGTASGTVAGSCGGGSSTWSCLGANGGSDDLSCSKLNADCSINGTCDNSTQFACTTGTSFSNIAGSCGGSSTWSCLGAGGGSSDLTCTKSNPACTINGTCDNSIQYACSAGTSSANIAGSCGGVSNWSCLGANGGTDDVTCGKLNPPCPVNGSCDNSVEFTCSLGTTSNNIAGSCGSDSTWSCLGIAGGTDDATCTKTTAACSVNGACNNAVQFACLGGSTSANIAGSCGGSSTWSCLGAGGGSDDTTCTKSNPACVVNGACDNSTQYACSVGTSAMNLPGSCGGSSTWSCLGAGGGSDDTSCNIANAPCPVNGSCDNSTQFACSTGTASGTDAGSCGGGSSTWSCLGANGGSDDLSCSKLNAPCSINGSCDNATQFACSAGTTSNNLPGSCGGSSTWSCLGAGGGSDDTSCNIANAPCPVNGSCDNSTQFACALGTSSGNIAGSCGGSSTWSCLGANGGSNDLTCSKTNAPCPVNGSCNNAVQYGCTLGTTTANLPGSCGGSSTWTCLGANGGSDAINCSKSNPACPINGSCDNTTEFACAIGTSSGNIAGSCGGVDSSTWSCLGANGGTDDVSCTKLTPLCPVNGTCDNSTQFACSNGTASGTIAGSCGGSSTWSCLGAYGGTDDTSCTKLNPLCIVNGACDNTTNFACTLGITSNNLPGLCGGSATWSCLGINGGTNDITCNKANASCPVNAICDNTTQFACTAGTTTANIAGSCGGSSTWSCLGIAGGSDDLTCTKSNPACPINGSCDNSTNFACALGTSSGNLAGSCGGSATWSCLGIAGGSDDLTCTKSNPACPVNAICDNTTQFACTAGTTSANIAGSCGGSSTWTCLGTNGGTNDVTCNKANTACPVPASLTAWSACTLGNQTRTCTEQTGGDPVTCASLGAIPGLNSQSCGTPAVCNNATQFACTSGIPVSTIANSCGQSSTWGCDSIDGGTNTTATACTRANGACINGSCNNSIQFACISGTSSGNLAGSCGGSSTWSCLSTGGGSDDLTCSKSNPACPVPASVTVWSACTLGNQTRTCTEQTGGDPVTCASLGAIPGLNSQSCGTPANVTAWSACSNGNQTRTCTEATGGGAPTCVDFGATPGLNNQSCGTPAVCDNSIQFACTSGTSVSNVANSCGQSATWGCNSADGGTNTTATACTRANAACINGSCNIAFNSYITPTATCATGNPTAISGTGPWTWGCNSPNGGTNTAAAACTANKSVDGSCDNSTNFACTTGTSSGNLAGSCGGSATWSCLGINGGTSDLTCTRANAACINGSCNIAFNSYITPTATCATGNPTAISGTGPWTWGCNSPNGGTNTAAAACTANKSVDCVGSWSVCSLGSQTYTISTPASNGGISCSSTNGATQGCGTPAVCDNSTPLGCSPGLYASGTDNGLVSCNTTRVWGCNSTDGGTNTTATACGKPNSPCAVNGACDNSTNFACTTGTSSGNLAGSCGGSATWSCLGANGGIDDLTCNKPNAICSVNGVCNNSTNFACTTGTSSGNLAGSCGGSATWSCLGVGGGSNDLTCSKLNSPCAINGACDNSIQFACTTGTSSGNLAGSCGGSATWSCLGVNGGSDDLTCNKANAICSVNGVCDNSTNFSCISGTADLTLVGTCGGSATWSCLGVGGGSDDETCNKSNPACPVPASVTAWSACSNGNQTRTCTEQTGGHTTTCASLFAVPGLNNQSCGTPAVCDNSIQFACTSGTSVSNVANSCDQSATWGCNSADGGINTTATACTRANAACINGSCNIAFNSYITPTATCATGNPTAISGTGPWTWGCNSPNGGTNTAAAACTANKSVDCVGSWSVCSLGSQTYTISTPASNGGISCSSTNGATQGCGTPANVTVWSACSNGNQTRTCTEATGGGAPTCVDFGATPGLNNQSCGTPAVCDNSIQFACTSGTSVSNVANSCDQSATWGCNSADGGINTTATACTRANAACINGSCNIAFNSYITPTATCATGNPTAISGTGPWTWGCNSPNGGTNTAAAACTANKSVDCVGSWSGYSACSLSCGTGSQTRTFTQSIAAANGGVSCTTTYGAENGGTQNQSCNIFSCTQGATCGGSIPVNATASTAGTYTQTWNGSTYAPTTSWAESQATCDFNCDINYTWNGSACIANTQSATCGGSVPANAAASTATTYTQTWNGSAWSPTTSWAESQATCDFNCNTNYTWNGSACIANTQVVSCGSLPINTTASTATTYTQTWNGSTWSPSLSWAPGAGTCGYTYNTQSATCGGGVPANAAASTATTYTQTWNGSAWSPTTSWAESQATCDFNCNANYTWNGSACIANTSLGWCGGSSNSNPANSSATTAVTFVQTWNGSIFAPASYSWSNGGSTCGFACNANYTWNGSACIANSQPCAITNGVGSQTWNGTSWGACTVVSCNTYYTQSGNTCVATSLPCSYGGGTVPWGVGCSTSVGVVNLSHGGVSGSYGNSAAGYAGSITFGCNNGSFTSNSESCSCISNWQDSGACNTTCGTGTKPQNDVQCGGSRNISCTDNSGYSSWGGYGACSASCGPGTMTRYNACGGSETVGCNNGACAVNCSYEIYQGGDCSPSSCGGYSRRYRKTVIESGGGTCPITEGQFIDYGGATCNYTSVPSANQAIACSSVAGSYGIPASYTNGTAFYRVETASCLGNYGQVIWTDISGCSAPITGVCSATPETCTYGATAYPICWTRYWQCNGSNGGGPSGTCSDFVDCSGL